MILIVEDSADQQRLLKQMLTSAGYKDVHITDSAEEALRVLKEQPDAVELAIVDFMLSHGDGIDLIREARRMPDLKDTPFILVTGRAGPEIIPQALEAGAADFIFKPFHWMELISRVRNALRLRMEIARRIAREAELITSQRELEDVVRRLEMISNQDSLTGVANRRRLDDHIDQEWRRAIRQRKAISVILADVDYFKEYNDRYGHPGGDDALRRVAQIVMHAVHRPADLVARYGGEEFMIVLPETPASGAEHVAHMITAAVQHAGIPHEASPFGVVTLSCGVACLQPEAGQSPERLTKAADLALYRAKRSERNVAAIYTAEQDGEI